MKLTNSLFCIAIISFVCLSCKKNSSADGTTYPKQVSITYRVSSSAIDSLVLITYDNETGGKNTVDKPKLPFIKTITKTVNKYENITVGYFMNPAKLVKMEILIDNKLVKSQENNVPNAAMVYSFQ